MNHEPYLRLTGTRQTNWVGIGLIGLLIIGLGATSSAWAIYKTFLIEVPTGKMAILIRKTGIDLNNGDEVAPSEKHKGIQKEVLLEGRHYRNPYNFHWEIISQTEIESEKLGVLVRLHGEELPAGRFLAEKDTEKGIVPGVKLPGRYPINPYLYKVIKVDPVTIDAGFQGVVTNLSGPLAKDPNVISVPAGFRGTQELTLREGTHLINPFEQRICKVDCRSQRFNLAENKEFGFPSKDGFWVSLDAIIEFRVDPKRVAEVYVIFNEDYNGDAISEELINKIILPNARSFCRLEGSNTLAKDFIGGRGEFQARFQKELEVECRRSGVEIIQALITRIVPPSQIATPIQEREIAKQTEKQYQQQILQQESEKRQRVQEETVLQRSSLAVAEQDVVKITTAALQAREVAETKAAEKLAVAQLKLDAAKDQAAAILSRGQAAAEVETFNNLAEAAGWKTAVSAFDGDGAEYARFLLLKKLAGSYQQVMINTADSPLMKIFDSFAPAPKSDQAGKVPQN
jgi:regulator of protease activity HflC (stomatin/prohibitin superfamily)